MKILNLTEGSRLYTCNVYLVTGSWNTMNDTNTLIDAGMDGDVIQQINQAATGVGKHKVEQVILTHSHYDHAGMVKRIKETFKAKIMAFSPSYPEADTMLQDGDQIKAGDRIFEVIHMPGHSADSICLYNPEDRVLFAGDSPLVIKTKEGTYEDGFIRVLSRIAALKIDTIYFGHGQPLTVNCQKVLNRSLQNAQTNHQF